MSSPIRKGSSAARKLGGTLLAGILCTVAALASAGCGAGSAVDPVAQAATSSTSAPGYRLIFSSQISSPALPNLVNSTGRGSFDARRHVGSLALDVNLPNTPQVVKALGGRTLHVEERLAGLVVYMKFPPVIARRIPGGKPWLKIDLARAAAAAGIPGLSSLTGASSDPSQTLQYLRGASGGLTDLGSERVDGFQTTHYRGKIDLNRVPDALPPASRAAARQSIAALEKLANLRELPVDVWVDRQHLVRRMVMSYSYAVQGQTLHMVTAIDVPIYGPQPAPVFPPADQVTDLNSLLASAGQSTTSPSP